MNVEVNWKNEKHRNGCNFVNISNISAYIINKYYELSFTMRYGEKWK